MWYVYIIRSVEFPDQEYTGATEDPRQRLADHNAGRSAHTDKYNLGNWSGIAVFQTSFALWNSRDISNPTQAAHSQRSAFVSYIAPLTSP